MEEVVTGKFEMVFIKINIILIFYKQKSLAEKIYLFKLMCFGLDIKSI